MRNTQALHLPRRSLDGNDRSAVGPMRLIVLDDDGDLVEKIENALWIWPHKLLAAAHVEEAIEFCTHDTPAAILIAVDVNKIREAKSIPALRRRLPEVPIVAVISREQSASSHRYLEQGADALLLRDDAHLPTLYDLIAGLSRSRDERSASPRLPFPALACPLQQSAIVGALICDVQGTVLDANGALAGWLGYADAQALRGRSWARDVLTDREDWTRWIQVAGDTSAFLRSNAGVVRQDGRSLRLCAEIFAVPDSPRHIQAVFKAPASQGVAADCEA